MGPGTLEAKIVPIAQSDRVSLILFIRKQRGPALPKLSYIILPVLLRNKLLSIISVPVLLTWKTIRQKPALLIGYHIIPYAFYVALAGYITKTPYIVCQTGLQIQYKSENRLFRNLLKMVFKHAVQINCPGSRSVEFWQQHFPKLRHKFRVLHSTIDTKYFVPDHNTAKSYDFIFLGRLAPIKNVDVIIRAFHRLVNSISPVKNHKMVIVGDGPESDNLAALVNDLNLNKMIHFAGFTDNPLPWLQQSRFLAMASTTEGLPTAMMQAMACGTVPITNLTGNIGDIVTDNESGFTFSQTSVEEIAEAMNRALAANDELLDRMKMKAREKIIKYHSYQSATAQWNEIFETLSLNS